MTPLVPRLRARIISTAALFLLALVLADLLLARWALGLPDAAVRTQLWTSLGCYGAALAAQTLFALVWLRPLVAPGAASDARVPGVALRFPAVFALAGLLALILANVAKFAVDLGRLALTRGAILGLAGATLAISLLLVALAFVSARGWMYPAIARLRSEELPRGLRLSVKRKVTFALLAVALATTLPPAVAYYGRVEQLGQADFRRHRQQLVETLAHGARFLDADQLAQTLASIDPRVARVTVTTGGVGAPSAFEANLPAPHRGALHLHGERALHPTSDFIVPLFFAVLGLALLLGLDVGHSIGHDVRLVTARVDALLTDAGDANADDEPLHAHAPQLLELQALATAVNELLARIADINVGNFVAVERILEADQVKTQFLANMSHDLRSPLNSILGFAELLQRGMEGELNEGQRKAVEITQRNATELLHLINEVLDAAKVEAGRMTMHKEDTLPAQFITEALKRLRERGVPETITVESQLQAGLPPVSVDGPRLAEALVYLLRFCIRELADEGRVELRTSLVSKTSAAPASIEPRDERRLHFEIAANVAPLSEHRRATLFDGFRRQPGHRGLGLGLPLARAFLEQHGGGLEVESDEQGLRFHAFLPVRQQKAAGRLRPVKI